MQDGVFSRLSVRQSLCSLVHIYIDSSFCYYCIVGGIFYHGFLCDRNLRFFGTIHSPQIASNTIFNRNQKGLCSLGIIHKAIELHPIITLAIDACTYHATIGQED